MPADFRDRQEWLETDGLGGFASGTVGGIRTRRYHGLLVAATNPPDGRFMLVNGLEVHVTTHNGAYALSSQRYHGNVVHPEGFREIESFTSEPWPTWRYRLPDGTVIEAELFMPHETPCAALSWRAVGATPDVKLSVRPLLSGRDYHALHHENPAFRFDATIDGDTMTWRPYDGVPAISATSNGDYRHGPLWYRSFFYDGEYHRGFDATEDLASPGVFEFDLADGRATLIFGAGPVQRSFDGLRRTELSRRKQYASPLHRSADQYLVRRGEGKTIIAGYPWFTDWGRDSFIALRGLCLATGRLDDAREVLLAWAKQVSRGMLPNRFPDRGAEPEYNSVDASLWYAIAGHEFLHAASETGFDVSRADEQALRGAVDAILTGYAQGTRYGIELDDDGLLFAGIPGAGVQLTWMDAKIGDWVVTPRVGKAVDVQALWLTALWLECEREPKWQDICERGCKTFRKRFWNVGSGCLYDVIDVDRRRGTVDASLRPNQILAVGGLPLVLLDAAQSRSVVDQVERTLATPMGLRSLAPGEPGYTPRYEGGPAQRDAAYHMGTAWPWLVGPFVEAWVRVHGATPQVKADARRRFLAPLLRHLGDAGIGHVSEIADAEPPHTPRGCPFQAWSIAEVLRLELTVLDDPQSVSVEPMSVAQPA